MLTYSIKEAKECIDILLQGDLDIEATEKMQQELLPQLENYSKVNLNFKNVPFVDSSGMGLLIESVRTLTKKSIKITISNVKEEVFEVFELVQIPEILGEGVFI